MRNTPNVEPDAVQKRTNLAALENRVKMFYDILIIHRSDSTSMSLTEHHSDTNLREGHCYPTTEQSLFLSRVTDVSSPPPLIPRVGRSGPGGGDRAFFPDTYTQTDRRPAAGHQAGSWWPHVIAQSRPLISERTGRSEAGRRGLSWRPASGAATGYL